ncbi:MAG TPA: carbamoyl-phosphate synthase large subunit, partial [Methanocorpusculum sp.]|nr:carbamoyl-phosphate synthase large subunit [Methanocorpusculum sp.]
DVYKLTQIEPFFLEKIQHVVDIELELREHPTEELVKTAKKFGFSNAEIRELTGWNIYKIEQLVGLPTYKMVDTCAAEFPAKTPYYYSTWEQECELKDTPNKKVLILGSGAIRIGQGIEFDYCTVHAVKSLREEGIEVHILNNNPETVSTDFDTSDRLYFEPMQLEDVVNILRKGDYDGVMVQFGGQNSVNLAIPIQEEIKLFGLKTKILGTSPDNMDVAEDRNRFSVLLEKDNIPSPANGSAYSEKEAYEIAKKIGYPVLVRPSYVLGGRAMELVHDELELQTYIKEAVRVSNTHPVLIDRYLDNATELDVDAVSDGTDVLIGGIMEHIEEAGVHSGDSACVIPTQTLTAEQIATVKDYTRKIALSLGVVGLINIQYALHNGTIYVLEANPRASRTVPFVAKATGIPLAKIAAKVMLGKKLADLGYHEKEIKHVAVKEVLLPFSRLPGVDPILGPEMKSTGEVIGIDYDFGRAFYKASQAADNKLPLEGNVFISITDDQKTAILPIAQKLTDLGFNLYGTEGTVKFLEQHNIKMNLVRKVQEGSPNIIDMVRGADIDLVINTPGDKNARADHFQIMRATIDYSIPYITTIFGAEAAVQAIESMKSNKITIEPLSHYHSE